MSIPRMKVEAAYGKLYVSGRDQKYAAKVDGAVPFYKNPPEIARYEISLTLESLKALRKASCATAPEFAACLTQDVLAWARAAQTSEQRVTAIHEKLATGWRESFPWTDNRTGTAVTGRYREQDVERNAAGQLVWKYREPFQHQHVLSSVAAHIDGVAFLCEMGTAKTRAAIEALRYRMERGLLDIGVVICPRGPMGTWESEVAQFSDGLKTVRLDGQVKERKQIISGYVKALPHGKLVLILNYDVLYLLVDELMALGKQYKIGVIEDEVHKCSNPAAKVTKAAMKLARVAEWRVGMTGTSIRKDIRDIWSQWYLLDLGITFGANFVQYKHEYMVQSQFNQYEMSAKEGANEDVGLRMRRRGMRYTKSECFDLPPQLYEKIELDLTPEQKKAYKEMKQYLATRLSDVTDDQRAATAANQLVMMLRLTQITSGHLRDDDGKLYIFPKNPKLDALEEIVRDNIRNTQQLVWAMYTPDIDAIVARLKDLKPRIIDGRQTGSRGATERKEIELAFNRGEFPLIVGNQAAGGAGLNLQAASMAHYFSQNHSLINRDQSESRCHRVGSEVHASITYNDFTAKGTIDEIITASIAEKKEIADIVLDLRRHIGLE